MCKNFKADLARHRRNGGLKETFYILLDQGVWATAVYRFGRVVQEFRIPIVSHIFKLIAFLLFKLMEIVTGVSLPASAQIGKGFYVGHYGFIIVHTNAKIGENCSVGPGVVIGTRGVGNQGAPVIGDNVYIGVGAKVLGNITIGNNVKIGANAVVLEDVPDGATVVGIPAKVVRG